MMEEGYYSYAMENGHDDLKKASRFIAKTNDENDLHEIYIKIKSSVMKDKDYERLLEVVNEIVEKNTKEVM